MKSFDYLKANIEKGDTGYWLGELVQAHEIGEYGFIEYKERDFRAESYSGEETGRHCFAIFIGGDDASTSASSLDMALIKAIEIKYDGRNSQAAKFFGRMIKLESEWSQ